MELQRDYKSYMNCNETMFLTKTGEFSIKTALPDYWFHLETLEISPGSLVPFIDSSYTERVVVIAGIQQIGVNIYSKAVCMVCNSSV